MRYIKYLFVILLLMLLFSSIILFKRKESLEMEINKANEIKINKLNEIKYNKLMIVAHPDDEMLWGGAHLIKDDYVVVCITCGPRNKKRNLEFKKVMKETNDQYITLNYPDKIKNKRDEWKKVKVDVRKDLEKIINSKKWDLIVTHNEDGEYGHIHHKMANRLVRGIYKEDNLYFFGKYYRKSDINDGKKITDEDLIKKEKIMKIYSSQENTILKFKHMWEYENFQKQVRDEKVS